MHMKYHRLRPSVYGEFGKKTVFDRTIIPPTVKKLHYVLDGWNGGGWNEDQLISSTPCFLVTEALQEALIKANITGGSYDKVLVTKSLNFKADYPKTSIPKFLWLKVNGSLNVDDLCLINKKLIVSDRALQIFKANGLQPNQIFEFQEPIS